MYAIVKQQITEGGVKGGYANDIQADTYWR